MNKLGLFFLITVLILPVRSEAEEQGCDQVLARILSIQGTVEKKQLEAHEWIRIENGSLLCANETVRTLKRSRATVEVINETIVSLDENTTLLFSKEEDDSLYAWLADLFTGKIFLRSREPHRLKVNTPFINAAHEGTEFMVTVDDEKGSVLVFDGQVAADNQFGKVTVQKGQQAIAFEGQAPQIKPIKISPEDAVQWMLYYSPILDDDAAPASPGSRAYFNQQAATLLNLGRVEEAQAAIDQAKLLKPDNANSLALEAVIAVAKNRADQALSLSSRAVKKDPQSAAARIAHSYALQAKFKLEDALQTMEQAVKNEPNHAIAWARLAELQLSMGDQDSALTSAQTAEKLNPTLGRTQIILGFADLAQVDIDEAKQAFEQAIQLDSTDPLARLGLGLAKIRQGDVEEGTRDMEAAVSLDPDNAVMRSYLGKAYYELKNTSYATTELAIAKEKDPKDPTPWFYDAILKQTTNRPVEALHDMQKAIELNDNRAVYRSSLLLDEDLAARTASQARIYDNLGFDRVGLLEARKSLNSDPTNFSAHRFLANSSSRASRNDITRVSELLQAQLLQPINITPVQPQMKEASFSVFNNTGPTSFTLNEYNPLFSNNNVSLLTSGLYGSNNTLADEAIISGVYNQFSASIGQYFFRTDGFRENDDFKQKIYTTFFQTALSSDLNAQLELYKEENNAGDVALRFNDKETHNTKLRQNIDLETIRFGLHYAYSANQNTLLSAIYGKRDKKKIDNVFDNQLNEKTFSIELQHLINFKRVRPIIGVSYFHTKFDQKLTESITNTETSNNTNVNHLAAYFYLPYQVNYDLTTTLGLSIDSFDDGNIDVNQLNPKFGLMWSPTSQATFRAAVFRNLKRQLITNQSIEPTQVAGFNQFFDNNQGSNAWHYGFGFDYKFSEKLYSGFELGWRDVVQPVITVSSFKQKESSHLAYFYWTPFKNTSLSAEYHFDQVRRVRDKESIALANQVITHSFPLSINFYHSSGLFTQWSATHINQDVKISSDRANASFWTIDAAVGYRLPKRYGQISLEATNLLNRKFRYHNLFDPNGIGVSKYVPELQLFLKLRLAF